MNTETLMLRRALGYAQPEEYVEWAIALLCADVDGPNLRILAGLNTRFERADVEEYFLLTCSELGLPTVDANTAAPLHTARLVHEAFLRGDVTSAEAISMMADLYRKSEYRETLLSPWMQMREELDGGKSYSDSPEALASLDQAFRRECSLLERTLALCPPDGWVRQSWCCDCKHVGDLTLVPPTLLDRLLRVVGVRSATATVVCARCGSGHQRSLRDPDVRLEYLDYLEKADPARHTDARHDRDPRDD